MKAITHEAIIAHHQSGSWRRLERSALVIAFNAQDRAGVPFHPKLGGGTRLMLALDHRISHDIDLFINDPQWIGYISPRLNDRVETMVSKYEEAADFIKLVLPEGEIDFIVRGSLLGLPDESSPDTPFPLEPVAEVLAKKLFYRGATLTPRDLFDWWSIETKAPERIPRPELARLLESRQEAIGAALALLPHSAYAQQLWDTVLAPDKPRLAEAAAWGLETLSRYHMAASEMEPDSPSPP